MIVIVGPELLDVGPGVTDCRVERREPVSGDLDEPGLLVARLPRPLTLIASDWAVLYSNHVRQQCKAFASASGRCLAWPRALQVLGITDNCAKIVRRARGRFRSRFVNRLSR